jgi:hypothetical protein
LKRLLALLGSLALFRAWLRRRSQAPPPELPDPRADELRRKLDESRPLVGEQEDLSSGETPVDADERRREVHERGRATIDEMRREE